MVVAACAGDRQPHQAAERRVDAVFEGVCLGLGDGIRITPVGAIGRADEEKSAGERPVGNVHQIAGNLHHDEAVIRKISIEGIDNPIAVSPGAGLVAAIVSGAKPVAVAGDIEPVAPPPLPILRRRQKPIDHPGKGVRPSIRNECIDFTRRRRKPRQIDICPAKKRAPIRRLRGLQPLRLKSRQHKLIHRIMHPRNVFHRRRHRIRNRQESPMRRLILIGRSRETAARPLRPRPSGKHEKEQGSSTRHGIGQCSVP